MSGGVLVIGESVLDIVRDGGGVHEHVGGSPLNVACGLGRLGVPVRFLTSFGHDAAGTLIARHLDDAGVVLVDGSRGELPTSTAIATIGADGSAAYEFDISWRLPEARGVGAARWIHVGSISTFLEPGAGSLEHLIESLPGNPVISYDPNIRPMLLADHDDARRRFERFTSLATLIKLSDEDARWLYPHLTEDEVIDHLKKLGAGVVALTRGARGARVSTEHGSLDVPSVLVDVVDTIGAGDAFMATLITDMWEAVLPPSPGRLAVAAQRAVTAAALTCARAGASAPTLQELVDALQAEAVS